MESRQQIRSSLDEEVFMKLRNQFWANFIATIDRQFFEFPQMDGGLVREIPSMPLLQVSEL